MEVRCANEACPLHGVVFHLEAWRALPRPSAEIQAELVGLWEMINLMGLWQFGEAWRDRVNGMVR
jgi:hypothetical protein